MSAVIEILVEVIRLLTFQSRGRPHDHQENNRQEAACTEIGGPRRCEC